MYLLTYLLNVCVGLLLLYRLLGLMLQVREKYGMHFKSYRAAWNAEAV